MSYELRYLLSHLDRCPHGRHEADHCSYCQRDGHDLNQGNPYAPLPNWRIGTDLSGNPITWADLQAALADLRASSVVVRRKCETCEGNQCHSHSPESDTRCHLDAGHGGAHEARDPIYPGVSNTISWSDHSPCPDCDNGWQLADGVRLVKFPYEAETTPTFYVIPARLIEGSDSKALKPELESTSEQREGDTDE